MEKFINKNMNELNKEELNKVITYVNNNEIVKSKFNDLISCIYDNMIRINIFKQLFKLNNGDIDRLLENKAIYKNKQHYYLYSILRLDVILKPNEWFEILNVDIDNLDFQDKLNRCKTLHNRLKIQTLKRLFKLRDYYIKEMIKDNIIVYEKTGRHCQLKNIEGFKTYLDNLNLN
jgi:hypothetical protein